MPTENTLTPSTNDLKELWKYLGDGYRDIFGKHWPPWLGGILLGMVNFALFAYVSAWYIYDGFTVTGDIFINAIGIEPGTATGAAETPWDSNGWVHIVGIVLGAFASTLLASDFKIRFPTRHIRLVEGLVGGVIMGVGAMLAPGCNIGGYFSAVASLSVSGFVMVFALGSGAYTGVLIARWRLEREVAAGMITAKVRAKPAAPGRDKFSKDTQPLMGIGVVVLSIAAYLVLFTSGRHTLGGYLLFGVVFGVILQRSGFCVTASFRELFTTGGGGLARGMILAMVVGVFGYAVIIGAGIRDPYVLPLGWQTFVGGYIFGLGMVIAGGCATGTLFRIGEGNVQLMLAFVGAAISASLTQAYLKHIDFNNAETVWLVDSLGWPGAIIATMVFLFLFYLVVQWNEMKRKVRF